MRISNHRTAFYFLFSSQKRTTNFLKGSNVTSFQREVNRSESKKSLFSHDATKKNGFEPRRATPCQGREAKSPFGQMNLD